MAASGSVTSAKIISGDFRPSILRPSIGFYYRSRTDRPGSALPYANGHRADAHALRRSPVRLPCRVHHLSRPRMPVGGGAVDAEGPGTVAGGIRMGFTVFYVAYAVFEMPTSWLGDRWGQRRMLFRIVGCWSIFTILTGFARSFATLLATRTVFGAAEAGAFPTLSRALSRWFPIHERGRANGLMWMARDPEARSRRRWRWP